MMKERIMSVLQDTLKALNLPTNALILTPPKNESFGDYSTAVSLSLAKELKQNPMEVAQKIVDAVKPDEMIEKVEVMKPGFINVWINKKYLLDNLQEVTRDAKYGLTDSHKGKKVIVEYSSPNIAKPFTIGHLRSTIIGDAIANLYEATGYEVFRDNHLGDWGTQFGKQIYAIKTWGNEETIEKSERPVKKLVSLYVKFHDEAEKNSELEEEGRRWFKRLEDGDPEAKRLWQKCIDWSWKEFDAIYQKLNVTFTEHNGRGYGESYFEDKMQPIIEELEKTLGSKGQYQESNGAKIVFFPNEKYPPLMIIKQDGATLYSTRDLATDKFRLTNPRYGKNVKIINEVGAEQSLYFAQLYETEKMLGWVTEGQRLHVKHGMYRFKDMKMSTRKGNVIWLEEVLEEATKRAITLGKETQIADEEATKAIGIGAMKWNDLKRSSHLDIIFDWDEILAMDGNSGPYMQYTYVRCQSVLKKEKPEPFNNVSINPDESNLIRHIARFPEVVADAAENHAPNYVCTYLFELAQQYNLFYQKNPILKADEEVKNLRLTITAATANVIQNGLKLLGIKTVEKM